MRLRALVVLLLASVAFFPTMTGHTDGGDLVNAVVGNVADPSGSEGDRIRAHLEAVAERLARADDSALGPALREARRRNLERLREYARAEAFPSKPARIPGRIPNFLDDHGNVCAVGYLVEQDIGRAAVAEIARGHRLDYVPYIDSPVLSTWQAASGLSPLELAMIQPTYGQPPSDDYAGYWGHGGWSNEELLEAGLVTANVVTSIANFAYLAEARGTTLGGWLGIVSGAASFIYGINEDNPTVTAAGAMASAIGIVSFGVGVAKSDGPRVSMGAVPVRDGNETGVGVVAHVRF